MNRSRVVSGLLMLGAWSLLLLTGCIPCAFKNCGCHGLSCERVLAGLEVPTVGGLARDLDCLDAQIDQNGSIVPKHPDVWGEARLSQHRWEIEETLRFEMPRFEETLQGTITRTDQAFLANALALDAAISGQKAIATLPQVAGTKAGTLPPGAEAISIPNKTESPSDVFEAFSKLARREPLKNQLIGFGKENTVRLEPTAVLNQHKRYLEHLTALRRINEGGDTSDAPGYSLNLLRIPISVLPGKATRQGFGAEVTFTIDPNLGDELLPTTFRNLVVNDLLEQLGSPVVQFWNNNPDALPLKLIQQAAFPAALPGTLISPVAYQPTPTLPIPITQNPTEGSAQPPANPTPLPAATPRVYPLSPASKTRVMNAAARSGGTAVIPETGRSSKGPVSDATAASVLTRLAQTPGALQANRQQAFPRVVPVTKLRRARLPYSPLQMREIFSQQHLDLILDAAYDAFERNPASKFPHNDDTTELFLHLPEVQAFLQEELVAAYRFLAQPVAAPLWVHCSRELVQAVRTWHGPSLCNIRSQFMNQAGQISQRDPNTSMTIILAWAYLVESALLNQQLIDDMRELAGSRDCKFNCASVGDAGHEYFAPTPTPEARKTFNEYVRCRWPIHVFALDPAAEQQNLGDTYSARREMQMSLSLAFASGQINARNMLRYARRLELDMETIELNQTAVGFSHGDNTFGWRFYPRFQTPETESNLTVSMRDLLLGGPNRNTLLSQRRLEPGMRECTAIVIMPSFVPYVTIHSNSNWFQLTNPKCKRMGSDDAVRLSKTVKSLETCSCQLIDACDHRDGEVVRLRDRLKQLEAKLPLQTASVQIPYENTLGGFAMFNTGITDLVPQLSGWYGAPGINPAAPTTLFLLGDNFNVTTTQVIAGGLSVKNQQLLSRQVIRVEIPANPVLSRGETAGDGDDAHRHEYVEVQVATPYGVTSRLMVPVVPAKAGQKESSGVAWTSTTLKLGYLFSGVGIGSPQPPTAEPQALLLKLAPVLTGRVQTARINLKLSGLPGGATADLTALDLTYDSLRFGFVFNSETLAADIVSKVKTVFGLAPKPTPSTLTVTGTIRLLDAANNRIGPDLSIDNTLGIDWFQAPR